MTRKRVVVAGLGDSGILTAIRLAPHADVVGISAKPALVSGQELGLRLSRPDDWARDYVIGFDRFRGLDEVRTVQGTLTGVDPVARRVFLDRDDGTSGTEDYDALVISTGVTNGFWRRPTLQTAADVDADLRAAHDRIARAESVVVIGGGRRQSAALPTSHGRGRANASTCTTPANVRCPHTIPGSGVTSSVGFTTSEWACTEATEPSCQTVSRATRSPAGRCSGAPGSRPPPRTRCSGRSAG